MALSLLSQSSVETAYALSGSAYPTSESTASTPETENTFGQELLSPIEILAEVKEKRSEFSKEYLRNDHGREVIVFPEQIHYEKENGL